MHSKAKPADRQGFSQVILLGIIAVIILVGALIIIIWKLFS